MHEDTLKKIGTGEAHAVVAEAWFTFLGFLAATAVVQTAEQKSGDVSLSAIKWISYVLLFRWVNYKVNQLIWLHFPSVEPENTRNLAMRQVALSSAVSGAITISSYFLVLRAIDSLIKTDSI